MHSNESMSNARVYLHDSTKQTKQSDQMFNARQKVLSKLILVLSYHSFLNSSSNLNS